MKIRTKVIDVEKVDRLQLQRIEIVTDDDPSHDRMEIYMLDDLGERIEGGTFSRDAFMSLVLTFYQANF